MPRKVIVVGGGAAGMMAGLQAARQGAAVTLIEKNQRLGLKVLITGNGRCNLTNIADTREFIAAYPGNGSFMYGPLAAFSNRDIRQFLADEGLSTKVEADGRVFPVSDRAKDVVAVFWRCLERAGVKLQLGETVTCLLTAEGRVTGVQTSRSSYPADAVIVATGGLSYPKTGSTGDGFHWAKTLGHTVNPPLPALVPLNTAEKWVKDVAGLTLKNVCLTLQGDKKLAEETGDLLFTHFGVSGPSVLHISRTVSNYLAQGGRRPKLFINLQPKLTREQLDQRLLDALASPRKQLKNVLNDLIPQSLVSILLTRAGLDPAGLACQITREQRLKLGEIITGLPLTITATRPIDEAIVTAGGVSVKEINPRTMESKLVAGLYLAGEVIDVDGTTGGYNLQAAFSTGFVAGAAAGKTAG